MKIKNMRFLILAVSASFILSAASVRAEETKDKPVTPHKKHGHSVGKKVKHHAENTVANTTNAATTTATTTDAKKGA